METNKVTFRCGCDPEVFLQDTSGNHVSALGYINADKWNPMQIPDMPQGFTLQEDNVALEYGIPPAATREEFVGSINAVLKKSLDYVPGLTFSKLSCTIFPDEQLKHPMAFVFGCEPDYNAWTDKVNRKPKPPHKGMRSAGGHVHVETDQDKNSVIQRMDLFLGVPSILMDNGIERKQMYGSAGACRFKPYGVEYRTLSNFWVFEDRLIQWVWDNTERALAFTGDWSDDAEIIQQAINTNDVEMAQYLIDKYSLEVV